MPMLIGLAGPTGAGKRTLATRLWQRHSALIVPLTGPIKIAAAAIFVLDLDSCDAPENRDTVIRYWGMSPSRMHRELDAALKRAFGADILAKGWRKLYAMASETDDIVVPDIRTELEAGMIRSLGGRIIHVQRTGVPVGSEPALERAADDLVIDNSGTIEQLYGEIDHFVDTLRPAAK